MFPPPTGPTCPLGAQPPARRGLGCGRDPVGRAGRGGTRPACTHTQRAIQGLFFINEKNVQGLNDRQEQIYSSSPEIKLK